MPSSEKSEEVERRNSMPVYEYKCGKCGHIFEKLVLQEKEEEELRCPKCKGKVERVMSVPQEPVIF